MQGSAPHVRVLVAAGLIVAIGACSDDPVAKKADAGDASDTSGAACHPVQAGVDGCCPAGAFYHFDSDTCVPVGPAECATRVFADPTACTPRWCADAWTSGCDQDDACWPIGQRCNADDGPGCPAGTFRATPGGPCVAAGTIPAWLSAKLDKTGDGGPGHPPGAPGLGTLPAIDETRFCADPDGTPRVCAQGEKGCGPRRMTDPDDPTACIDVGVPWHCPAGFVEVPAPATSNDLPGCAPDPADCGDDPFGGVQPGPGVVFVDASAAPGGDGSREKPYVALAKAVTNTLGAKTVAVAAGEYKAEFNIFHSMQLRGRCAAKVRLLTSTKTGVWVGQEPGAKPTQLEVLVRGITVAGTGIGLVASKSANVRFERVHVASATQIGIAIDGTKAVISESLVENVTTGPGGWKGQGIAVGFGGDAVIESTRIRRAMFSGIWVQNHGTRVRAEHVLIDATQLHPINFNGIGVSGFQSEVTLRSVRITRMPIDGIRLEHPNSSLHATGVVIDRIGPEKGPAILAGGIMSVGPDATLRGVRIHKARPFGVALSGNECVADFDGVIIDDIGSSAQLHAGGSGGIVAANGVTGSMRSMRLHKVNHLGLAVEGTETHVQVRRLTITSTLPEDLSQRGGIAVSASLGSHLDLADARLHDSRAAGALVFSNASMVAARVVVDGTRGSKHLPDAGLGLAVDLGGRAHIRSWRLHDNRAAGIQVQQPGARLLAEAIHIDGTRPTTSGHGGGGISVIDGGAARIRGARVVDSRQLSLLVRNPGSRLSGTGILVRHTRPGAKGLGMGIVALQGGRLIVQGSHVQDSRIAGIHAVGPDNTSTRVVGTIVETTVPGDVTTRPGAPAGVIENLEGAGISAFRGPQQIDVLSCVVRKNHTAGIAMTGVKGSVVGSLVMQTQVSLFEQLENGRSTYVKLADALLIQNPTDVAIREVIAVDQARAGILLNGPGKASVDRCAITGSLFGMAVQAGIKSTIGANVMWNNESNNAGDIGLHVPPTPKTIDL